MKIPKLLIRKKLRASTARRSLGAAEMEYEEMAEPNMKLSRALLIVLVLHVVAVAGIIAFNTIKSRQGVFPPPPTTTAPAKTEATPTAVANAEPAPTNPPASLTKPSIIAAKASPTDAPIPKALPVGASESGNFYVVAKGDNPVKIAKKLKVSESELLAINHIDDPRKLQIGQKLIVPAKAPKGKKSND
jgi:LysM repeat protein